MKPGTDIPESQIKVRKPPGPSPMTMVKAFGGLALACAAYGLVYWLAKS